MKKNIIIILLGIVVGFAFNNVAVSETKDKVAIGETKEFFVPPPAYPERVFPCTRCHDNVQLKTEQRKLKMNHADIVFKHAEEQRWCLDCHDAKDRTKLRLINQELIDFDKSYTLCGQCHGTIFRDWQAGVHGKRIGMWNGKKLYRLCINCHNPHAPKFKPLEPQVRPLKPLEANLTD